MLRSDVMGVTPLHAALEEQHPAQSPVSGPPGGGRNNMTDALRLRSMLALGVSAATLGFATHGFAADAAPSANDPSVVQTLVVTAQRREEAIQDVPIAVSAFSADTLKTQQIAGGEDLLKAIPNVNFAHSNFGGYNFQIRGIGTKGTGSTSADAGIGVHENDVPLVSNNLGAADFFDVERVEVLRGPQGTLYGRNATGGAVNVLTNKPKDRYEAGLTVDVGNYNSTKLNGFVNIPFGDTFAVRAAAYYQKRDGTVTNDLLNTKQDDRDLYSTRLTASWKPNDNFRTYFMWEHFNENDNRDRVGKQLCINDPGLSAVGPLATNTITKNQLSQGCANGSLYSANAYGATNSAESLAGLYGSAIGLSTGDLNANVKTSHDLRTESGAIKPIYQNRGDTFEFNAQWDLNDNLTLSSQSSYATGKFYSKDDYNRVGSSAAFNTSFNLPSFLAPSVIGAPVIGGVVADPQVGTTSSLRIFDIQQNVFRQASEEFRLQSHYKGKLNFSVGGNFVDYTTQSNYYVFGNGLNVPAEAIALGTLGAGGTLPYPLDFGAQPNGTGFNYYNSRTDYNLRAYAAFGEVYYQLTDTLKVTGGLRYTVDRKRDLPFNVLLLQTAALPKAQTQTVAFKETTGRLNIDWTPTTPFTDKTLVYATYSRGYKGGGFNSPSSVGVGGTTESYQPEFVDAIEIGTKNVLLGGSMVLNGNVFYYDYSGYQIGKIINRASVTENVNAKIYGAELEGIYEPIRKLRFNGTVGYLHTEISNGSSIDQLNLTQGDPSLVLVKSLKTSNCTAKLTDVITVQGIINAQPLLPAAQRLPAIVPGLFTNPSYYMSCEGIQGLSASAGAKALASFLGLPGFSGFALQTNANGTSVTQGQAVSLKGKELPNSPKLTVSAGVQYQIALSDGWNVTPRYDFYFQDESYSRIYNSIHDRLKSYTNSSMSVTAEKREWQLSVQAYVKNLFDKTYIQDTYVTDASSGLYSNVFVNEPRTYGVAVTKKF